MEVESADFGAAHTPTVVATQAALSNIAPPVNFLSNFTVGPVYDMLNTSASAQYAVPGIVGSAAVGPTGVAIVAPGDPYVMANYKFGYNLTTFQAFPRRWDAILQFWFMLTAEDTMAGDSSGLLKRGRRRSR